MLRPAEIKKQFELADHRKKLRRELLDALYSEFTAAVESLQQQPSLTLVSDEVASIVATASCAYSESTITFTLVSNEEVPARTMLGSLQQRYGTGISIHTPDLPTTLNEGSQIGLFVEVEQDGQLQFNLSDSQQIVWHAYKMLLDNMTDAVQPNPTHS